MADHSRIAELERRVERDPASIAFAQLAEEYRREGRFDDAVRVCRAGLTRHPVYPSARVTLGRALRALGQDAEAQAEFVHVVREAPDNLAARRALDELRQLRGSIGEAGGEEGVLLELESWLVAIAADRAARAQEQAVQSAMLTSPSIRHDNASS